MSIKEKLGKINQNANTANEFLHQCIQNTILRLAFIFSIPASFLGIIGLIRLFFPEIPLKTKLWVATEVWLSIMLGAFLLITISGAKRLLSKNRELQENQEKLGTLHYLQTLDSKYFGLSRKLHIVKSFLQKDGSLKQRCETKLVATTERVDSIEHYSKTSPFSHGDKKIQLEANNTMHNNTIQLIPEIVKQEKDSLFWKYRFVPSLKINEAIKYGYTIESLPDSFAMNYSELEKRKLRKEFVTVRISYPTEHFIFSMTFPVGFNPQNTGYEVWLGEGQVIHRLEMARIEQSNYFSDGRDGQQLFIELKIKHPIHGLIYVLTWMPPNDLLTKNLL